jgi:hypothetical protein
MRALAAFVPDNVVRRSIHILPKAAKLARPVSSVAIR